MELQLQDTRTDLCGRATWRTLGGRLEACQYGELINDESRALDLDARFRDSGDDGHYRVLSIDMQCTNVEAGCITTLR